MFKGKSFTLLLHSARGIILKLLLFVRLAAAVTGLKLLKHQLEKDVRLLSSHIHDGWGWSLRLHIIIPKKFSQVSITILPSPSHTTDHLFNLLPSASLAFSSAHWTRFFQDLQLRRQRRLQHLPSSLLLILQVQRAFPQELCNVRHKLHLYIHTKQLIFFYWRNRKLWSKPSI